MKQFEIREIKKAINHEGNRFLSNRATIRAGMSAYKKNDMGDLVLDIEKAKNQNFVYSEDMPRKLENIERREYNKRFT